MVVEEEMWKSRMSEVMNETPPAYASGVSMEESKN